MMDRDSGRFVLVEQNRFDQYADIELGHGVDLVTVGRFDRMNFFAGTSNDNYTIYDNVSKSIVGSGKLSGKPIDATRFR
jgi:hypothetical protein